jgi:hypothetical protein
MMQTQGIRFAQPRSTTVDSFLYPLFDDGKVFRKTIAGHREFEQRKMPLRPELRRLLIMIDGRRTTQALEQSVRPRELGALLGELQSMGLVDTTDTAPAFQEIAAAEVLNRLASASASELRAARDATIDAANELLGIAAKPHCLALAFCTDTARFGTVLNELAKQIEISVGQDGVTVLLASMCDACGFAHKH